MKIAHVIGSCSAGGAEMFVQSLLLQLEKRKDVSEIELWVMYQIKDISSDKKKIDFEDKFIKKLEVGNISIQFIGKRIHKDWLKTWKKLRELYRNFEPDIIHSHLESVTFHTCRGLSKFKTPIVQTIHNTVINHTLIQRFYIKRKISAFVSISKKVTKIISDKLKVNNDEIYLIYNGVDVNKFKLNGREIKNKVEEIISVGRLTKQKDHKNLFKAIKLLKEKLTKNKIETPKFLIVGDGELKKELKNLALKLKINNNVEFLGIRDDIPKLLSESDIYVMSSEWEGLSISLIEAVASEIPIVATDAGSNSEIVKDGKNGEIVPIQNSQKLAESLYRLITNKDLRIKYKNNSQKMVKKFEIENSAAKHYEMYKDIIGNC